MKIELHAHTKRYSICSIAAPFHLMEAMIGAGYGAVYITEHDRVWNDWELAHLRDEFPHISILSGVELSLGVRRSQHLLVLGTNDEEYLRLRDPAEVLAKARQEGHLTILAHPCRWEDSHEMLDAGLLPDAVEYRTCNHDAHAAERTASAARQLGLPLVNAGDIHALDMVGQFWIETAAHLEKPDDIRDIILMGNYRNCAAQTC